MTTRRKTKTKQNEKAKKPEISSRVKDEIAAIIFLAVGFFMLISLQTNAAGKAGAFLALLLKGLFGHVAFSLSYILIILGILLFAGKNIKPLYKTGIYILIIITAATILNSGRFINNIESLTFTTDFFKTGGNLKSAGLIGMNSGIFLVKTIGVAGLYILTIVIILVTILVLFNKPLSDLALKAKMPEKDDKQKFIPEDESKDIVDGDNYDFSDSHEKHPKEKKIMGFVKGESWHGKTMFDEENEEALKIEGSEKEEKIETPSFIENVEQQVPSTSSDIYETGEKVSIENVDGPGFVFSKNKRDVDYKLPPIDLLSKNPMSNRAPDKKELHLLAKKLEGTLTSFNVSARVINVVKGPAVTRYEIQPDVGVKVNSIVRLADDIALNLEARSIRMEAPIPGKPAIGIEVENDRINLVGIREIIESPEFARTKSKTAFALGKDISGRAIVGELKEMPHLLIAGSTGSGKSVCLNTMIVSILYRASPDEVKLVLIDPKVVELGNYNGIPHLLIPVVTEPSKASAALGWAVTEMTDRYKKFAASGARDLEAYNYKMKEEGNDDDVLPNVVIVIDELADLMMVAPNQVEESICRLAQMARAAGMHLIVATQRPSVDVITGVIKANIPSRISFAVSSQFDSRTILDMTGAEKLVGKGDMLFNPIGLSKPLRVQGAFISDSEVHKVTEYIRAQVPKAEYADDVIDTIEKGIEITCQDEDELLPDAIETVVRAEQASASMLQRRFRIGYNRAARLIDMMEARNIIGPSDGSRPRRVLISIEEYENLEKNVIGFNETGRLEETSDE